MVLRRDVAGWNYQQLDQLNGQKHVGVLAIAERLWESFFGGDEVPLTLAVHNLSKVAHTQTQHARTRTHARTHRCLVLLPPSMRLGRRS